MRDPAHQREAIVGLTHTEIMLVLAVVILMLLLAKDFQLKSAHTQIEKLGSPTVTMTPATETPNPSPDPESDDDLPVDETLSQGGGPPQPKQEGLGEESDNPPVTVDEETNLNDNNPADTSAGPGTDTTKEPDNHIIKEESLKLQNENKKLMEEIEDLREKINNLKQDKKQKKALRDKIGFVPCWPGNGKPWYYFTYKITYYPGTNTFRIEPHPNWKSKNDIVSKAVNGGFPMLKKYPQGIISRAELLSFGITLDKQKRDLYGKECYLAVTINKKGVDGTVIEFLRDSVHFYPIY